MAEQSFLAKAGLRIGTVGSAAALALAFGNAGSFTDPAVSTAANRTGWYADLTASAERIGTVVGGLRHSNLISNGTLVDTWIGPNDISTATNGPGTQHGILIQGPDGTSFRFISAQFQGGASTTANWYTYACQGTSGVPGATIASDGMAFALRGHDGTGFTTTKAAIVVAAGENWSNVTNGTKIQFQTTPTGSTTLANCGIIDINQIFAWGGNNNGKTNFNAGTLGPKFQILGQGQATSGFAQSIWINGTSGPLHILAKSRSGTIGTMGVITTGDTLGTISWQGDDGTNFIQAANITVSATGTIGTGQISGNMTFNVLNASATLKAALTLTALQSVVCGNAALATNATDGFLYIASCAGTPTGVPTANTGRVAIIYDTTNNKIAVYNGAWKQTVALI